MNQQQVKQAVTAARDAFASWSATPADDRIELARRFATIAREHEDELTASISAETGKPIWESRSEAKLVPAKVDLAIEAWSQRCRSTEIELPQGLGRTVHRSIGVLAILGPFNFPAHLPNGHLVPAVIAGNTAVFKPSEWTPKTGRLLGDYWSRAGLPSGVVNVIEGDRDTGAAMVNEAIDGVLFTGSYAGGCSIHRALAGRPEVMLALEMGGNNPIVVAETERIDMAADIVAVSAFISAGQRCTCARRLIIQNGLQGDALLDRLLRRSRSLRFGLPDDDPEPFMGRIISADAAEHVIRSKQELIRTGAIELLPCERSDRHPALLSPGILDVSAIPDRDDEEIFGPLLQVIRVSDFEAAIGEANRTRFGLSAALLADNPALFQTFRRRVSAGVVNWNQPTIGASGRLPFGGLGRSGNHRPSGFLAADYCATATAELESSELRPPAALPPLLPETDS